MDEATYDAMPASLILREARAGGFILVSTFTDPRAVKKQELLELYRLRWHLELDLRSVIKAVTQVTSSAAGGRRWCARKSPCISRPTTTWYGR